MIKYNGWQFSSIDEEIKAKAWRAKCEHSILSAPSTPRLIEQAANGRVISYLTTQTNNTQGTFIIIRGDSIIVDYEEIIGDPNVKIDCSAEYLSLKQETRVGYVIFAQNLEAKVPDDIRNLLISTGNLTVEYIKSESVSCSI